MLKPEMSHDEKTRLWREWAACPQEVRDWAETHAYKDMEQRLASATAMHAQATALATVLVGACAWVGNAALQVLRPHPAPEAWAAAATALYLCALVYYAVHHCLSVRDAPAVYNRPSNLILPGATLEHLRIGELVQLEERIRQQTALNNERAAKLNRVRLAAVGVVPVFAVAAIGARWLAG